MYLPIISRLPNWLSNIKYLSNNAKWEQIFSHYQELTRTQLPLHFMQDPSFIHPILKACQNLSFFTDGYSIHASLIKNGMFESYTSVQNSIMDFYVKARNFEFALAIFDEMKIKDSVSWNVVINGSFNQDGILSNGLFLFSKAVGTGMFEPNVANLVLVIQECRNVYEGLIIHCYVIKRGFCSVSSVQNSLLRFYVVDHGVKVARLLFDEMSDRDVVSWSVMIGGYAQNGESQVALGLFREMVWESQNDVDAQIMVSVLQACISLRNFRVGSLYHGFVLCKGLNFDLFVGNSLIDMYSKYGDLDSALEVFREMPQRNLVSWNSMLSGFVHNKKYVEAISLFCSMSEEDIQVDEVTVVNLLQICKHLLDPYYCQSIHCAVIRRGYELNKLVANSLIDVYSKCNLITHAWLLFSLVKDQDTVTWSTMIAGFTHCGLPEEAIAVFKEMNFVRATPNTITMVNLMEACSSSGELNISKWAHAVAIRRCLASEVVVGTAILDMYAKCGAIDTSRKVFNQISQKNIVTWSAMIAAYGMNGLAHNSLTLFQEMKSQGLKPNEVTTLSILSACSHGGLVEEGISLFRELVQDHDIDLRLEHYSCMVDLLGRSGRLDRAVDLMETMSDTLEPGASAWGAMLSACRRYGNSELGIQAVSQVLKLEPSNSSAYILASNMFAAKGLWNDSARMRLLVKEKGVKVEAGYSLIHVKSKAEKFVAGGTRHLLFQA
nr:PREDICTED: pentatricopeptide repeat-containing protein At2g17210 isoform X2 [Daucus carota subsp. sativus]